MARCTGSTTTSGPRHGLLKVCMTDSYVELHGRSAFSFLEGASPPEEMATECAHLEMDALALLDRNGVYGAPQFHKAALKQGITAHIGAEVSVNVADASILGLTTLEST